MQIIPFPAHYQSVYTNLDISLFSLISCKIIGRLLEAKRASFIFQCLIFYYKVAKKIMYYLRLNILLNNLFFITIYHYHKSM